MTESREEMVAHAIEQGMDPAEAEHLVDSKCSTVVGIQLPPRVAAEVLPKVAKVGMLTGPVRFYICISEDRRDRVAAIVSDNGKEELVQEWDFSMADQPERLAERVRKGFNGLSSLGGTPDTETH